MDNVESNFEVWKIARTKDYNSPLLTKLIKNYNTSTTDLLVNLLMDIIDNGNEINDLLILGCRETWEFRRK